MHFCCSHYISPCFLSTPFPSLSLSPPSFSLWLQDTCHLMPFTKYPLLNQSFFFTPYPSIAHIKFTNYSPTIFYIPLRLPSSELLEKHFFRSRANRRLVHPRVFNHVQPYTFHPQTFTHTLFAHTLFTHRPLLVKRAPGGCQVARGTWPTVTTFGCPGHLLQPFRRRLVSAAL